MGEPSGPERVPPQSPEAEAATLGSMLLEGEAVGLALEALHPEDFYRHPHRRIFESISDIYMSGQQPDELVLCEHLKGNGELESVGGVDYVRGLVSSVPSAANVERYAQIVKDKALARRLIEVCTDVLRQAYDSADASELVDRAESLVYGVSSHREAGREVRSIRDILDEEFKKLEARQGDHRIITGIPTGLKRLDELTGGLQPSDLIILAARTSVGKSSLALNIIDSVARRENRPVLLFSVEMSKEQVAGRMLATRCNLSFLDLRTGYLPQEDWDSIVTEGMGDLREAPIFVDDTPSIGIVPLRARARRMRSTKGVELIVVDYLQLVKGPRTENRQQEVAEISRALKALARELEVPVIALSQIRRAAEDRPGGRPQLTDLRESGAIEQDADVVLMLHRAKTDEEGPTSEAYLEIAKQRNGPTGKIPLTFNRKRMMFTAPYIA